MPAAPAGAGAGLGRDALGTGAQGRGREGAEGVDVDYAQSHAMIDVDYHFSNLWFAAQNANWPLAASYLNETKRNRI